MRKFGLTIMMVLVTVAAGQADMLALWENDNILEQTNSTPADDAHADVSAGDLELAVGLVAPFDTWDNALDAYIYTNVTTLTEAIAATHYYSFTVAPNAGKQVDYSNIFARITLNDKNAQGASVQIVLMSSITGFTEGDEIGSFTASTTAGEVTVTTNSFDISTVTALQDQPSPVEFRLYVVPTGGAHSRVAVGHIFFANGTDDLRVDGIVEDATTLPVVTLAMWNNDNLAGTETNNAVHTVEAGIVADDFKQSHRWYNSLAPWPNSMWALCSDIPEATNLVTAIAENRYYTLTVTPEAGKVVDYSSVAARVTMNSAGNAGSSATLVLMSSVTGFNDGDEIGSFVALHNPEDGAATDNGLMDMDISGVAALKDITGPVEFRIYVVLNDATSNRLGFGHIFFVDGGDDLVVKGTIDDLPIPDTLPADIISLTSVSSTIMKMVVDAPSAADLYYPVSKTDLVGGGAWTAVAHSDDGTSPFIVTNLSYSSAEGTNEVIYVQSGDVKKFFEIWGVQP